MELETSPVVRTQMLIRRPAADVYRAFADPAVTSRFWFSRGSGPLVAGETVTWWWDVYGVSTRVMVLETEEEERIVVAWNDPATRVEWTFAPRRGGATLVTIVNSEFSGTGDERVRAALDAMGGFSFVLAAAKAWLEHGVALNLVADHNPDAHVA